MYKKKKSEIQMLDLIFCMILQYFARGIFLFVFFRLCYNGERNFENAMF